jgi:hypothetical protein
MGCIRPPPHTTCPAAICQRRPRPPSIPNPAKTATECLFPRGISTVDGNGTRMGHGIRAGRPTASNPPVRRSVRRQAARAARFLVVCVAMQCANSTAAPCSLQSVAQPKSRASHSLLFFDVPAQSSTYSPVASDTDRRRFAALLNALYISAARLGVSCVRHICLRHGRHHELVAWDRNS